MDWIRYDVNYKTFFFIYQQFFECYDESMAPKSSPYRGYRIIGPQRQIIYARSLWEANFARYLQWLQDQKLIEYWQHEPRVFYFVGIKRGCTSYIPDFYVREYGDKGYWVEVKGWMDAKSKTKIKRFKKYFPDEELRVVEAKWFKENEPKLKPLIPDWETKDRLLIAQMPKKN